MCFFIIPTDPQFSRLLNKEERSLALARIDADQAVRSHGRKERTTTKLVLRSFSFSVGDLHPLRTFNVSPIPLDGGLRYMFFDGQHLLPGAKLVYANGYIHAFVSVNLTVGHF